MPLDPNIMLSNSGFDLNKAMTIANQIKDLKSKSLDQDMRTQQFEANKSIAEAYRQSLRRDGTIDESKLMSLMSQGPGAGMMPGQLKGLSDLHNSQLEGRSKEYDMALKQHKFLGSQLGKLTSMGDKVTHDDVMQVLAKGAKSGMFTMPQAQEILSEIPQNQAELPGWVKQHYIGLLGGTDQLKAMTPNTPMIDTGSEIVVPALDPLTNAPIGQTARFQKQLTPEALVQNVPTVGPKGEPSVITKAQQLQQMGIPTGQMGGQPVGQVQQPGMAVPNATGRFEQAPQTPGAMGMIPTGLPPGEMEARQVVGKGSAENYVADNNAVGGSSERIYQLDQALQAVKNTTTGKGSEKLNAIKSYLSTAGIPGIDAEKIANYDEANKYLMQYALAQAGRLGQGTDGKLAATLSGNASTSISNLATQDVIKANIGLERMKQAKVDAFNSTGASPSQYQKFSTIWNRETDPRIFIWNELDQSKKKKIKESMSENQRKDFDEKYNVAVENGWVGLK